MDRGLAALESDRGGWTAMLVAMAASIAVSLWLTRGTTFWFDEFTLFSGSRGYNITGLLTQHNAQLILLPRLIYATVFKLFGPDYLAIRTIEAVGSFLSRLNSARSGSTRWTRADLMREWPSKTSSRTTFCQNL